MSAGNTCACNTLRPTRINLLAHPVASTRRTARSSSGVPMHRQVSRYGREPPSNGHHSTRSSQTCHLRLLRFLRPSGARDGHTHSLSAESFFHRKGPRVLNHVLFNLAYVALPGGPTNNLGVFGDSVLRCAPSIPRLLRPLTAPTKSTSRTESTHFDEISAGSSLGRIPRLPLQDSHASPFIASST